MSGDRGSRDRGQNPKIRRENHFSKKCIESDVYDSPTQPEHLYTTKSLQNLGTTTGRKWEGQKYKLKVMETIEFAEFT